MAAYTFDAAGRLETVSDGTDTFTYHYLGGSANLLESVEGPAHTTHYMYESGRNNVRPLGRHLLSPSSPIATTS